MRYLPGAAEHTDASFPVSDQQWNEGLNYGFAFIACVIFVLWAIGFYYFSNNERLGQLKLWRIIVAYIFQDSFWFFYSWFCSTQFISIAIQLYLLGADFTLKFVWLQTATA